MLTRTIPTRTTASVRGNHKKKTGYRPELQGLRAIAVSAVIFDHLFHFPSGGFTGVDIFFVISGFLITGLLLREHDRTGSISFKLFYARRLKRIVPAATIVLLVTTIISYVLFVSSRANQVLADAVSSLLFVMNWKLAADGTDYMNAGATTSPLQHYWSLSVEEQFYFVWPWMLLLASLCFAKKYGAVSPKQLRWVAACLIIAICALSFWWSFHESTANPTVAYFDTTARAWELGIGALIAVTAGYYEKLRPVTRTVLTYIGLFGITASVIFVNPTSAFPAPWAVLPVISTALIIAANTGGQGKFTQVLTNKVSGYIGNISFSLYLWHFPIILFFGVIFPKTSPLWFILVLTVILAVSALSYHTVEYPLHKSPLFEPAKSKLAKRRAWVTWRSEQASTIKAGSVTALALLTALLAVVAISGLGRVSGYSVALDAPAATVSSPEDQESLAQSHADEIATALSAKDWPDLQPAVSALGPEAKASEWVVDGCLVTGQSIAGGVDDLFSKCTYGPADATRTAVVLGDSMAISYVPGIRAALEPEGYKVVVLTMEQCPIVSVSMKTADGAPYPECDTFRGEAIRETIAKAPDLVIMSSSSGASGTLASGAENREAVDEWRQGVEKTGQQMAGMGGRVVTLDAPPGGVNLQECMTRVNTPESCVTNGGQMYMEISNATSVASSTTQAEAIKTQSWFCSPDNRCPSFIGSTPVYADKGHLTEEMSNKLGPLIHEALFQ